MSSTSSMTPGERLARAREEAGFATATEAARAFGWNENTYRSHENGERGIRADAAQKYAKAFKTTPNFILFGIDKSNNDARRLIAEDVYPRISGSINEVGLYEEYPSHGFDGHEDRFVETDLALSSAGWLVEVRAARPIVGCFPGDLLVVQPNKVNPSEYIGKLAIIETVDSEQYLRRLRAGTEDKTLDITLYPEFLTENTFFTDVNLVSVIIQSSFWQAIDTERRDGFFAKRGIGRPTSVSLTQITLTSKPRAN